MDNTSYLKQLAEAEKKQKQTELAQAKTQALTEIGREEARIMPEFTKQKQTASVQSQIGAKNFAEFLAQRGQTRAGLSSQAELSRENVLGRTLGEIGTAQNQAAQQFANQRTDMETQYQNQLTNAYNQIGAQLSQNLYNERLRQEQMAREDAQRKQQFQQEVYLRNLSNRNSNDRTGKINTLQGTTLDRNAVLGMKGVPSKDGKSMIWSIPQSDGSITQVWFAKGVNPFTGAPPNKTLLTNGKYDPAKAFSNGYQPNTINGKKIKSVGSIVYNGQKQSIWQPVGSKTKYVWDGIQGKYIVAK